MLGLVLDAKYRLVELIGQGGMGEVYRAVHVGTQRPVAVKVLLSSLLLSPEATERFRREARAAGGLRHPNVVDVTDFGVAEVDGREVAYIAMEHLEGSSLRALLDERGALPLDVVLDIVEQIAAALEAAHGGGIVHRDLKPDNVWLVHDPRGGFAVRVLDFGIALVSGELVGDAQPMAPSATSNAARAGAAGTHQTVEMPVMEATPDHSISDSGRLTGIGAVVGTPHYMSPEQIRGEAVSARSDVYALGVLAWEAIAGRRPFPGDPHQVLHAHLTTPPPPLPRSAAVVQPVLDRALAKSPAERFPSARAFAGSLRVAAESPGTLVRHSLALYASRFPEMRQLAWHCGRKPALFSLCAMVIACALLAWNGANADFGRYVLAAWAWAMISWGIVTMHTHAAFGLAMQRLRTRPLDRLDAQELDRELRAKLGLPADARDLRTSLALAKFSFQCESRSRAGTGDLAIMVGLLEPVPLAAIGARCAELFVASRRFYRSVAAGVIGALVLVPVVEFLVLVTPLGLLGPSGKVAAMVIAASLVPLNATLVNPIFSSAVALVYFRACLARGEDMPMAAVLPGRL